MTQPVSEDEAKARLAIIASIINHRDHTGRTLAVVRMAADGVSLIDLVVEQQIHDAISGPAPHRLDGAA